jgi:hypothetical protein
MPRAPRHKLSNRSGGSNARRAIAALAARLIAEDGISDYGLAKRKAARTLGASESDGLPSNTEVDDALRDYLAIYEDEEQPGRLLHLRRTALEVMNFLTDFRPYLRGAVLDGTATRFSRIELDLFADSAKEVEIFLLMHDIEHDSHEPRQRLPESPETLLYFDWEDIPVTLAIFSINQERQQKRSDHSGRPLHAKTSALIALLEQSATVTVTTDQTPHYLETLKNE